MEFVIHHPSGILQPIVKEIIYFKDYQPPHTNERMVPDTTTNLIFELDDQPRYVTSAGNESKMEFNKAWLSGFQTSFITFSSPSDGEMVVARFHPGGAYEVIHRPMSEYAGKLVKSEDVWGNECLSLREQINRAPNPDLKIGVLEKWLKNSIHIKFKPEALILQAIETIQINASIKLAHLVDQSRYSRKQFIFLFKKYVGVSPKRFQRIVRFNEILTKVEKKEMISWTQISCDCGYFDQAHFIKDFKAFSGINPSKFLELHEMSERINFFPFD